MHLIILECNIFFIWIIESRCLECMHGCKRESAPARALERERERRDYFTFFVWLNIITFNWGSGNEYFTSYKPKVMYNHWTKVLWLENVRLHRKDWQCQRIKSRVNQWPTASNLWKNHGFTRTIKIICYNLHKYWRKHTHIHT